MTTRFASLILVVLLACGVPARAFAAVATQVSAGVDYTCAVDGGGGAACWGANFSGQLGDGSTTQRTTPTSVLGMTSGVAAISSAHRHTCALTTGGGVKCWGRNQDGELGNGTTIDSTTAVDVTGLASGVASLSTGPRHACVVTTGGGVKCWGDNTSGALGDGSTTDSSVPVDVVGLASGIVQVVAGSDYSCALTTGGGVKCWGDNASGALGDGTTTDSATPVDVAGFTSGVTAVSTTTLETRSLTGGLDFRTCVRRTSGGVACWPHPSFSNGDVYGLTSGVAAIDLGGYGIDRGLALLDDGSVVTFDMRSRQFGPPVNGLQAGVVSVSAGDEHLCVVTTDGEILCRGSNIFGGLGTGNTSGGATVGCVVGFGDGDFDRICDDSDPCTSGQHFAAKPKPRLTATRVGIDPTAGNDQLAFRAQTDLPPATTFADLDLGTAGARLTVVNPGGIDFERVLAGGAYGGKGTAGWTLNSAGSRWTYTDATGAGGSVVVKLTVTDRSRGASGGPVDVNLSLRNDALPIVATDLPLQTIFVLGDASAGAAGRCAQTPLVPCTLNRAQTTVVCR